MLIKNYYIKSLYKKDMYVNVKNNLNTEKHNFFFFSYLKSSNLEDFLLLNFLILKFINFKIKKFNNNLLKKLFYNYFNIIIFKLIFNILDLNDELLYKYELFLLNILLLISQSFFVLNTYDIDICINFIDNKIINNYLIPVFLKNNSQILILNNIFFIKNFEIIKKNNYNIIKLILFYNKLLQQFILKLVFLFNYLINLKIIKILYIITNGNFSTKC
jgi:hypothetical protein